MIRRERIIVGQATNNGGANHRQTRRKTMIGVYDVYDRGRRVPTCSLIETPGCERLETWEAGYS